MQLELQNVGYSYNGKELVLRHVNYRFEGGRIYAITGRSGAGKTTLLSLLSQLTKPTEGSVQWIGCQRGGSVSIQKSVCRCDFSKL